MLEPYTHPLLASTKDPLAPIIVIGMHRSGTTLLSKLLSALGVHMGEMKERNHEAMSFLETNDVLLRQSGADWRNPHPLLAKLSDPRYVEEMTALARKELDSRIAGFGEVEEGQPWGWKDPRTTLTLPVWLNLFPGAKIVHIIRNGVDVALSLNRRAWKHYLRPRHNDRERLFPVTAFKAGYELWEIYLEQVETYRALSDLEIHELFYEGLIANASSVMHETVRFCDLSGKVSRSELTRVVEKVVNQPTKRSRVELLLARVSFRLGIIDSTVLKKLHYQIPPTLHGNR